MPAHVDEGAELGVPAADENDGDIAGPGRNEGTDLGQLARMPHVLPGAAKDLLLLESGH